MENWREIPLSEIVETVIDYRGKTPKKLGSDWADSGFRALSAKNIKTGKIVQPDTIRFVDAELYAKWMKEEIQRGDIIITSEAPFGEVYYWDSDEKIVLSQRLFGLRCKKDFCSRYIYMYMTSHAFQAELLGRATGTTVIGLRQPELLKCKVRVPNLDTQVKIAEILGCIEDKINLNTKLNANLEELGSQLFYKWLNENNYEFLQLREMSVALSKGTTPTKADVLNNMEDVCIPFIKVKDMSDNMNIDISGLEYISEKIHSGKLKRSIVQSNDILFSIAGTIGRVAVIPEILCNSNINQAVAFIRLKDKKYLGHIYFWLKSREVQNEAISKVVQGVQANLSLGVLGDMLYPVPKHNEEILEKLNTILVGKLHYIEENLKLVDLRDSLLPKLMSGAIDLSEIDLDF